MTENIATIPGGIPWHANRIRTSPAELDTVRSLQHIADAGGFPQQVKFDVALINHGLASQETRSGNLRTYYMRLGVALAQRNRYDAIAIEALTAPGSDPEEVTAQINTMNAMYAGEYRSMPPLTNYLLVIQGLATGFQARGQTIPLFLPINLRQVPVPDVSDRNKALPLPNVPAEAVALADDVSDSDQWVTEQLYMHALHHARAPEWNVLVLVGGAHRLLPVALRALGAHTNHTAVDGIHALLPQFFAAEAIRLSRDKSYIENSMIAATRAANTAWSIFNEFREHRDTLRKAPMTGHQILRLLSHLGQWALTTHDDALPSETTLRKVRGALKRNQIDPDYAKRAIKAAENYHRTLEQELRKYVGALTLVDAQDTHVEIEQPSRLRRQR